MRQENHHDALTTRDIGIFYAATGERHRAEAIASAERCKAVMPEIPIAIWTDSELSHFSIDLVRIAPSPYFDYMDKVTSVPETPFGRTLFLDTDTYLCTNVSELFGLLDRFDIAAAHATNRESTRSTYLISGVPAAFPEMNTGVLLYHINERTATLFAEWHMLFERDRLRYKEETSKDRSAQTRGQLKPPGDQSSFRQALFRSDLRIATLPPEYNFRFKYTAFAGSEVKILHGRHQDMASIAAIVNSETKRRVYVPSRGILRPQLDKVSTER